MSTARTWARVVDGGGGWWWWVLSRALVTQINVRRGKDQNEWKDDCSLDSFLISPAIYNLTQNTDLSFYWILPATSCSKFHCGEWGAGDGPDHPGARPGQVGDGAADGPGQVPVRRWQRPGSLQASWQINRRRVSQCPLSQPSLNEVRVSSLHL